MSMLLGLLRQVIVLIPMIMILPNFIGLNGIWLAQPTADIVSAIITGIVLVKEMKKYDLDEEVECIEELEVV